MNAVEIIKVLRFAGYSTELAAKITTEYIRKNNVSYILLYYKDGGSRKYVIENPESAATYIKIAMDNSVSMNKKPNRFVIGGKIATN